MRVDMLSTLGPMQDLRCHLTGDLDIHLSLMSYNTAFIYLNR